MRRLFQSSDVVLVTPSAAGRMRIADSQVPVVTLAFRLDARSIEQLSALIARRLPAPVTYDRNSTSRRVAARGR